MKNKIWLVTGCSSGIGKELAKIILKNNNKLIATSRNPKSLNYLNQYPKKSFLKLKLDISKINSIKSTIKTALNYFKKIDVLVNNSGYGLAGPLELYSYKQIQKNYSINFLGPVFLTKEIIPIMRKQKSGNILNLSSSIAINNQPGFSIYGSSKSALESFSEAIRFELNQFNIFINIFELGPCRTNFSNNSLERHFYNNNNYNESSGDIYSFIKSFNGKEFGNPILVAEILFNSVFLNNNPFRIILGKYALKHMHKKIKILQNDLKISKELSFKIDF